jgi:hypothetical protein
MRIFPAIAAAAVLAATPCMAQVIISGPDNGAAARHDYHAQQQENASQRDEYKAHVDAAQGNYGAAQHEQNKAIEHQDRAQHQANRAAEDSRGGVRVQVGQ